MTGSKLCVKERGLHNYTYYVTDGVGITIDSITKDGAGYITGWSLSVRNTRYKGTDLASLLDAFRELRGIYELKNHGDSSKDILVIFTDNIKKVRGFLSHWITGELGDHYIQLCDNFEIRPMVWNEALSTSDDIAEYAQWLIDTLFVPDKYFYLTPNQVPRRRVMHSCDSDIAKEIFPNTSCEYSALRKSLFGGICYCPYPGKLIDEPIIEIDLNSAYIYCMLIEKHCMTEGVEVNPDDWEYYLDSNSKASVGSYEITYGCTTRMGRCYKDINGERVDIVEDGGLTTKKFILTSIDLKILLSMINVISIKCSSLTEFTLDYLPTYFTDVIVEEYTKKNRLKGGDERAYKLQKSIVNGLYGDTIRKLGTSRAEWKAAKKSAVITPHWGIFTTSYCKRLLISMARQLDGWVYSDTDSIYCFDTPENRERIDKFNSEIREKVNARYGDLQGLGEFKLEAEIVKFKAIQTKCYMYLTKEGKMVLKAAGCNKESIPVDTRLFKMDRIPIGKRIFPRYNPNHTECDIDGRHLESYGSYWEMELSDEAAEAYIYFMMMLDKAGM